MKINLNVFMALIILNASVAQAINSDANSSLESLDQRTSRVCEALEIRNQSDVNFALSTCTDEQLAQAELNTRKLKTDLESTKSKLKQINMEIQSGREKLADGFFIVTLTPAAVICLGVLFDKLSTSSMMKADAVEKNAELSNSQKIIKRERYLSLNRTQTTASRVSFGFAIFGYLGLGSMLVQEATNTNTVEVKLRSDQIPALEQEINDAETELNQRQSAYNNIMATRQ